jgi:hypothetical protein
MSTDPIRYFLASGMKLWLPVLPLWKPYTHDTALMS